MNVKCVMLEVANPSLLNVGKFIVNNYFDYINVEKCVDSDMINCYSTRPHITLLYGLDPEIGEHMMYHLLKIKNRELYRKLKDDTKMTQPEVKIGVFRNEDSKVLYLDCNNSNIYETLKSYHEILMEFPNTYIKNNEGYQSHITLTYLKPDCPEEVIDDIIKNISTKIILYSELMGFLLSSEDKSNKLIKLN